MDILGEVADDHGSLTGQVDSLGQLISSVGSGARPPESIHEEFVVVTGRLHDELLQHFGVEEECIFPFLEREFPTLGSGIAQLEASHDSICGALLRLVHLARRGGLPAFVGAFDQVAHVFARFESVYLAHVDREADLLRRAASQMSHGQRERLDEAADGLL